MQCTRLKHPVSVLSSECTVVDSMWEKSRLATAPPALWPVMSRLQLARSGFSSRICRSRAAMGRTIALATLRNPAWHRLPSSSRKPCGETGSVFRLTPQSLRLSMLVPRIANTIVFLSSHGTDLTTMALVPVLPSADTKYFFSAAEVGDL